jgi:hypothetical protein
MGMGMGMGMWYYDCCGSFLDVCVCVSVFVRVVGWSIQSSLSTITAHSARSKNTNKASHNLTTDNPTHTHTTPPIPQPPQTNPKPQKTHSLADLWWPGPVFHTITGHDIENFYTARLGSNDSSNSWNRRYSLVLTYDPTFPYRDPRFDPQKEMVAVWGDAEHPQGAVNPILVFREILPASVQREDDVSRRPFASYFELDAAATGRFAGTMVKAHRECVLSPKSALCHSPQFLKDTLETGYYPSIEVWKGGERIK